MKKFNYGAGRNPEKTVVHCPTQELAQRVLKFADTDWRSLGEKMYERDNWEHYKEDTCYWLTECQFSPDRWYIENDYDIISAEEFLALNEPFTLPEKWAVRLYFQEAIDYANKNGQNPPYGLKEYPIAHYPSLGRRGDKWTVSAILQPGYTLLTKEQFLQHVWKKPNTKEKNPFKIGDKVWHPVYGWREVVEPNGNMLNIGDEIPPVEWQLLSFTEYTLQGFSQERPEPKKPEIKPLQLIYVKGTEGPWVMEYFSHWDDNGYVTTYRMQAKDGDFYLWPEYSLTNPLEEDAPLYAHIKPLFDSIHPNNSNYVKQKRNSKRQIRKLIDC